MSDDIDIGMTDGELRRYVARSERAQSVAHSRQEEHLGRLLPQGPVPCVSCDKAIERDDNTLYENDAVMMRSHAGYGSRHDMDLIWFVICDDCVERKALRVPWFEYYHEALYADRVQSAVDVLTGGGE